MIDAKAKALYQANILDPLLRWKGWEHISPTALTGLGLLFGLLISLLLPLGYTKASIGMLCLSGLCDSLDGALARKQNRSSPLGAVLDISADRLVEFSIVLSLYLVSPTDRGLTALLILGSILLCVTTFLVVAIFSTNESEKSFHYSPGLIERSEAFCFFACMFALPKFFFPLAGLFAVLVTWTALFRVIQFSRAESINSRFEEQSRRAERKH